MGCVPAEQKMRSFCVEWVEQMLRMFCCCVRDVAMERRMEMLALAAFSRTEERLGRLGIREFLSRKKSRWQWESTRGG